MTCAKMLPPPWQILAMSPFKVAQLHWGPLISLATDQTLVRAFGQDNRHEWAVSASRNQVSQQFHGRLGRALAGHVPIGERRIQAVVATTGLLGSDSSRCMASAGLDQPRVLRGRPLSSAVEARRCSAE